jgi:CheY-like chemotaxis protein
MGAGTTVEMVLPAFRGQAEDGDRQEEAPTGPLDLRVLLVEDNPDVAAAVRPLLEALGCSVTHFAAAAPALAWLRQHPQQVDAVLTDVVMPGEMDGLALAQEVRSGHPQLGLVVMTGYAEHLEQITREGFTVLPKPWTAPTLARALREAAAGR